ncbi:glycosyltransferase [Weissella confusa]
MIKKHVLLIASTASMIKQFNLRNLNLLKNLGFEVHVAANFLNPGTIPDDMAKELLEQLKSEGFIVHQVDFKRGMGSPFANFIVLRKLSALFDEYKFEFIHVHAALASVLVRIMAFLKKIPVIYTIHGMQFSKESSWIRWALFFPVEWVLSFVTSTLITINEEDAKLVERYFHPKEHILISGVGIDYKRFASAQTTPKWRSDLGLSDKDVLILTVGELSARKNQQVVIKALGKLSDERIHYLLVGIGDEKQHLEQLALEENVSRYVHFLGYQTDLPGLVKSVDGAIYPSKLEGLLTAGIETLASGTPIMGANVRGIEDYVREDFNDLMFEANDTEGVTQKIKLFVNDMDKYKLIARRNSYKMMRFDKENIDNLIKSVYLKYVE